MIDDTSHFNLVYANDNRRYSGVFPHYNAQQNYSPWFICEMNIKLGGGAVMGKTCILRLTKFNIVLGLFAEVLAKRMCSNLCNCFR